MATEIKAGSAAAAKLPKQLLSDPADVAAQAYRATMNGQVVLVPGLPNQITAAWAQVTPRWLTRYVTGFAARRTDWLKVERAARATRRRVFSLGRICSPDRSVRPKRHTLHNPLALSPQGQGGAEATA
jgi:hypothetical protein